MMDGFVAPANSVFRHPRLRGCRARQGGFNFAEVLFAVMILGIGFIMTAAIFPVALMQTKTTQEETAAAAIARGGANALEQIANNVTLPATGVPARGPKLAGELRPGITVVALDLNTTIRGSMILPSDPRYAWVPFYRREGLPAGAPATWAPFAQVYMLPVAARNRSIYDMGAPTVIQGAGGAAVLGATIVDSTANADEVDYIEFPVGVGSNDVAENYTVVGAGAYVIIAGALPAAAGSTISDPTGAHARVGHIFRIGNPTATQPNPAPPYPRRWELVPGSDYVPLPVDTDEDGTIDITPTTLAGLSVFVVGRELTDPTAGPPPGNPREGLGQDVAAYTTFVNIR